MKKIMSIGLCLAILALCCAPLFFPNEAKAEQPPTVQASDLEAKDTGTNFDALPDGGTKTDQAAEAQAADPVEVPLELDDSGAAPGSSFWQVLWAWIKTHSSEFVIALLALVKVITNLTPTEKDNRLSDIIERLFSIFPNFKKGGGTFPPKA